MLFYHKGLQARKRPLSSVADDLKAAILCVQIWSEHSCDVVGLSAYAINALAWAGLGVSLGVDYILNGSERPQHGPGWYRQLVAKYVYEGEPGRTGQEQETGDTWPLPGGALQMHLDPFRMAPRKS